MTHPKVTRHFLVDCPTVPGSGAFNFMNLLQGRVDNACRAVTAAMFLSHGMRQDTAVSLVVPHPACEQQTQRGGRERGKPAGGGTRPQPSAVVAPTRAATVTWVGSELVGVWPDEKSIATRLQKALCHHFKVPCPQAGNKRTQALPAEGVKGVTVFADDECGGGFAAAVLRAVDAGGAAPVVVLLDEHGSPRSELDAAASKWAAAASGSTIAKKKKASVPPTSFIFAIGGPEGLAPATAAAIAAIPNALAVRLPGPSLHAGSVITLAHNVLDTAMDATGAVIDTAPAGAMAAAAARGGITILAGDRGGIIATGASSATQEQPPLKKRRKESSSAARSAAQRIEAMYQHYKPARLHKVTAKLREFAGDEESLLSQLIERWGPEPPQ